MLFCSERKRRAAFAIDVVLNRFAGKRKIVQSILAGIGFLALSLAVNWPFADFMLSPQARNWVFGMNYFGYSMQPSEYHLAWEFQVYEKTRAEFWVGMVIAMVATILSVRIGLLWGDWMRRMNR